MGKHKRSAAGARWLVASGCEVASSSPRSPTPTSHEEQRLDLVAERHGLALDER